MTKSRRKKLIISGILLSLLATGCFFVVEDVFPYMGIKPWRLVPSENAWRFPNGFTPDAFQLKAQKLAIKTPDGLTLSAWLVESNLDTTYATVVQLHGISNCKESNFSRARVLADSGYASMLLDLRAHGESGGEYCTFGFCEKNDLKVVSDTLVQRFPNRPIAIWGASLGGAIALQAMAADPRFAFGIIESTFDEYPKVVAEYGADYLFGFRPQWVFDRVMHKSGEIAHFDPYAVMPVKSAAMIDRPVLFIHGDKDARIPIEFNKRNFEAVKNPGKKWFTVAGGGHSNLWTIDGPELKTVVNDFLKARR